MVRWSTPPESVSIGVPVRVVPPPAALQQCHLQDAVRDLPEALFLLDLGAESSAQQPVAAHRDLEHRRRQLNQHLRQNDQGFHGYYLFDTGGTPLVKCPPVAGFTIPRV